jgi:hypothetical protein
MRRPRLTLVGGSGGVTGGGGVGAAGDAAAGVGADPLAGSGECVEDSLDIVVLLQFVDEGQHFGSVRF